MHVYDQQAKLYCNIKDTLCNSFSLVMNFILLLSIDGSFEKTVSTVVYSYTGVEQGSPYMNSNFPAW